MKATQIQALKAQAKHAIGVMPRGLSVNGSNEILFGGVPVTTLRVLTDIELAYIEMAKLCTLINQIPERVKPK